MSIDSINGIKKTEVTRHLGRQGLSASETAQLAKLVEFDFTRQVNNPNYKAHVFADINRDCAEAYNEGVAQRAAIADAYESIKLQVCCDINYWGAINECRQRLSLPASSTTLPEAVRRSVFSALYQKEYYSTQFIHEWGDAIVEYAADDIGISLHI